MMTFRAMICGLVMLLTPQFALATGPSPLRFIVPDRSYSSGSQGVSRVIAPRFGVVQRAPGYGFGMQGPSRRVPIPAPRSSISFNTRGGQNYRSYPPRVYSPPVISPQVMTPAPSPSPIGANSIPALQRDSMGREFIVSGGQTIYFNQ